MIGLEIEGKRPRQLSLFKITMIERDGVVKIQRYAANDATVLQDYIKRCYPKRIVTTIEGIGTVNLAE